MDCLECPLHYKTDLIPIGDFKYKQLFGCKRSPEDLEDPYIPDIFSKPTWCPLLPLPEKKYITPECLNMASLLNKHYNQGYNYCLDDIQKGNKND